MSLFIVIRKSIKDGFFPENTNNPSADELLGDLKTYPQIYLFPAFEDAKKMADIFFYPPRVPKNGGAYALVAEVTAEFKGMPVITDVDQSTIYNNWVDSQKLNYGKEELKGTMYKCVAVAPEQIKSIVRTFIPDNAKAFNPNLQNTEFVHEPNRCLVL